VLPGVAFRGINESYTATTGVINPLVEQTFIAGGEIKVDIALTRRFGPQRRAREEKMQVKKLVRTLTDKIINGANATSVREFDGIKTRLTGVNVVHNSAASGGAALSLYKLDRLIDKVTEPTHILMPKAMRTRLTQAGRNTGVGGYVAQTKDDFGQLITTYRGLPILIGYQNEADGALIDFTEVANGGGSAVTCLDLRDVAEGGHVHRPAGRADGGQGPRRDAGRAQVPDPHRVGLRHLHRAPARHLPPRLHHRRGDRRLAASHIADDPPRRPEPETVAGLRA
jgi:hypothetical protein